MEGVLKVASLMLVLWLISCGQCSSLRGTYSAPVHPTSIHQALRLFDHASHNGDFLQAQRALYWINSNYVDVLRSPHLADLSSECLIQILSQTAYIDEIEVFRAVKRIIETPNTRRFKVPLLISMVRFVSIDVERLRNEVVPSGIWPQLYLFDALLEAQSDTLAKEFTRRPFGNSSMVPISAGNIIAAEFGARIVRDRSARYTISAECNGRNPIVPAVRNTSNAVENCFIESEPGVFTTVYLGGEFIINEITTITPSYNTCPNLRLEVSLDNRVFNHVATISSAYSTDSRTFDPCLVAYIRYRSERCSYGNLRVNALIANSPEF